MRIAKKTPASSPVRPVYVLDKRWANRRECWRAPGEVIRPGEFGVELLREAEAKAFVVAHHYAGSMPAARLCAGLYRKTGVAPARLVGVAVFSVPIQNAAIPRYTGLSPAEGVELGRFALLPEVAFNGETWFLRRAFRILVAEKGGPGGVRAIISYADPLERRDVHGVIVKPAHAGQIYQAHNALYAGRASARTLWLSRAGQVLSPRALAKIANGEQGREYAARQLLTAGAPARAHGETPADWMKRVLPLIAHRVRHPGNHVFAFGLDLAAKRSIAQANAGGQPYPRVSAAA